MGVVWGGAKLPIPPPSRRVPAITLTSCSGDNAPCQFAVSRTRPVCVCVCVCVICCTYLMLKYIATDGGRVCATRPTWATSGSRRSSACAASATCSGGGRRTIPPLHLSRVCVRVCVCVCVCVFACPAHVRHLGHVPPKRLPSRAGETLAAFCAAPPKSFRGRAPPRRQKPVRCLIPY